jgi:phospholipase/lecithinase/hemolysin
LSIGKTAIDPDQRLRYPAYNLRLQNRIRQFASSISEAGSDPITVLYFSFYKVFTSILDAPEEYGFLREDLKKKGGSIWFDNLHPTSKVHAILAAELDTFLSGVESNNE